MFALPPDTKALFVFVVGLLDPDPWKRWTAYQASNHPFITGQINLLRKKTAETKLNYNEENQANKDFEVYWMPPLDPGICRRKLLNVQRLREKQNAQRKGYAQSRAQDNVEMRSASRSSQKSPSTNSVASRVQPMMVADSPSVMSMSMDGKRSPPSQIATQLALHAARNRANAGMVGPSSLSAIGNAGIYAALGTAQPMRSEQFQNTPSNSNQRVNIGPQSYTGLGLDDSVRAADFTYALQRPGNVPGLSSDGASVASQATMGSLTGGSVSSGQHLLQQSYGHMNQNMLPMHAPMYPGGNQGANVSSLPNSAGYSNSNQAPARMGGVSYQGGNYGSGLDQQQGGIQYLSAQQRQQQPLQIDPAMVQTNPAQYQQLLMQQQQEQLAALQRQHEQQLAALQQQQQLAFQQQQQAFLSQQFGGVGQQGANGYYYVTSADGTPVLMQQQHHHLQQQQQQLAVGPIGMGPGSYDGSLASAGGGGSNNSHYMMLPQQQQQQQRSTGYEDIGNGASRSVRDNRSRGQTMNRHGSGRQGGGVGGNYRGNSGGMSM